MKSRMLKPTILSISLLAIMATAAVAPAVAEIKNAFPGYNKTIYQLILTIPATMIIPFSLVSGWLVLRMKKKTILFVGLAIYILSGCGSGFAQNVTQLLIMRGILGVGIGLIFPLANTLIFDFFEGKERNKTLGLANTCNAIGGIIFLSVSGILASILWRLSFAVYALAFVTLTFVLIWLIEPSSPEQLAHDTQQREQVKIPAGVFGLAIIGMMCMIVFYVTSTDLALFIESERQAFSSTHIPNLPLTIEQVKAMEQQSKVTKEGSESFKQINFNIPEGALFKKIYDANVYDDKKIFKNDEGKEIKVLKEWKIVDRMKEYTIRAEEFNHAQTLNLYSGMGTSKISGYALAVMMLAGAIAGLILHPVLNRLKNFTSPIAAILMGLGFFVLSISSNISLLFLSMAMIGFASNLLSPPLMLTIPKLVSQNARALGVAIYSSCLLFGQFVSPLFMKLVETIFRQDTFRFRFTFIAGFLIIGALIAIIFIYIYNKKVKPEVKPV